jgi:hypothetical protein
MISRLVVASRVANCPNCGGQVEFKAGSSLLSVCPYCSSAVARLGGDVGQLEILGQVAPLADLGSPLSIGTRGKYRGKTFTIVGQVQLDHGTGPWNEWYVVFDEGNWAWVAEAQGRVYLTSGREMPNLPAFGQARVGSRFRAGKFELTIVERKRAQLVSASGELPFAVKPGAHLNYADIQGPQGLFGTIDYGQGLEAEALYLGEELGYDQLFDDRVLKDVQAGEAKAAVGLNCPHCGAGVELKAPDESMRITCPACDSLLDCNRGELKLLSSTKRSGPEPMIPLSAEGTIDGTRYTVYGHLTRSVTVDGVKYLWEEYLLRAPRKGWRWLVCSNNHWSFIEPISAGDVDEDGRVVRYAKDTYRHFQSAAARVEHLRGEFYWKVEVGERAGSIDYVCPPYVLSKETAAEEVSWSRGKYLEKSLLEKAFALKKRLPRPFGVAPNMPNPMRAPLGAMLKLGVAFSLLLLLVAGVMAACSGEKGVISQELALGPSPGTLIATEPFEVSGTSNMAIRVTSDVSDGWLHLEGKLINETMNEVTPFGVTVRYHSGMVGGDSWASGARQRTVYVGSLRGGRYVMQLTPDWKAQKPPTRMRIEANTDVFIGSHATVIFFLLWLLPLLQAGRYYAFEKQRWSESDHAGW